MGYLKSLKLSSVMINGSVVGYLAFFFCLLVIESMRVTGYVTRSFSEQRLRLTSTSQQVVRRFASATNVDRHSNFTNEVFRDSFSVAPMMDYTDRFQRKLFRLLSRKSVLYTEMVTSHALTCAADPIRFLEADLIDEDPVVLQLGGSDPLQVQAATKRAVEYGYREINLNVGCPSVSVSDKGCFGAVLMLQPGVVGEICARIGEVTQVTPTVKCRIGVDDSESYELLTAFIDTVHRAGQVTHFIVHARKAVLGGKFTPEQNRNIPPLKYDYVYRLKKDFPHLTFTINGGIKTIDDTLDQLSHGKVDGVMIGRAAVNQPFHFRHIDSRVYKTADPGLTRRQILQQYANFAAEATRSHSEMYLRRFLVKPLQNLFQGEPHGKMFRKVLQDNIIKRDIPVADVIHIASQVISDSILDHFDDAKDVGKGNADDRLRKNSDDTPLPHLMHCAT